MDDAAVRTLKVKDKPAVSRRLFVIKPRERKELPGQTVEIPSPSRYHQPPAALNMITMILPPAIMVVMYGVLFAFMMGNSSSALSSGFGFFFLVTPIIGMGMPLATYISHKYQVKKYAETLKIREGDYREKLRNTRFKLDELASLQREILNGDYPLLPRLIQTGLGKRHQKYLWWRRMADPDFLFLRMGTGYDHPSFSVVPPKVIDVEDPLFTLSQEILQAYKDIPQLPVLLDLKTVGSVGLSDRNGNLVYGFSRKLILDVIVHHSPQDVQVVVLGDTPEAQERWEWLKWAPHTRAIYEGEGNRRLAFESNAIDKALIWLMSEFEKRTSKESRIVKRNSNQVSIVVLLDDSGFIRRSEDIKLLSEFGRDAGIYLIFVGGRENWPRECRASIEIRDGEFIYTETFAGEQSGVRKRGDLESAGILDCERIARTLAGLEISIGGTSSALPRSVRLFDILEPRGEVSRDSIKHNWETLMKESELLQFPFGQQFDRKGLGSATLNLLPEKYLGFGAYHTILVGTTGSGKSEFMKSLVLSSAYKYSPRILNFFLMDFKGGSAFNRLKDLPHVAGVVTNLNPLLVERALVSIETEFDRRQKYFDRASVKDLWEYNTKYIHDPLPHILLVLDEFSLGMNDFPALPRILADLVRGGRSLGMYMFLANQDVNSAVDRLLSNVGWRIALKLANQEEMHVIDRSKPKMEEPGRGYLRAQSGEIFEFQAAFSGFPMQDSGEKVEEAFRIFHIDIDGNWQPIYSNARRFSAGDYEAHKVKEQDYLISSMKDLSVEAKPAEPFYLDPLEPDISLEEVFKESEIQRKFDNGDWPLHKIERGRLVAPIGYTDSIEERTQAPLQVDFEDQDGHLWLIGAAASGKAMTIETTLLSLALTNTPEDVWFYLIDFGAMGRLKHLSSLPHCGAYITPRDYAEMVDRLFRFLDDEMERRTNDKARDIFLIINNFSEFRNQYADYSERLIPYVNNGKAAGIHLIFSTNRETELFRKFELARRIVLRLTDQSAYSAAAGSKKVSHLPVLWAEGSGLWVDGKAIVCQVARARVVLDENGEFTDPEDVCETLAKAWHGGFPPRIRILPAQIPLADLYKQMIPENTGDMLVPVGLSYETMQPVTVDLLKELPRWLVLGPPRSGKSNFLISIAETIHSNAPDQWDVRYISLRRTHSGVKTIHAETALSLGEALQMLDGILNRIESAAKQEKKLLLLLDDLGSFFEPGKEALAAVLNNFALKTTSHDDVFIIGAGLQDELIRQGSSRLVQDLRRNKTGIVFSRESADLDFMGIQMMQLPMQYRRMDLNPGRGFWCSGGKPVLVQSPLVGK